MSRHIANTILKFVSLNMEQFLTSLMNAVTVVLEMWYVFNFVNIFALQSEFLLSPECKVIWIINQSFLKSMTKWLDHSINIISNIVVIKWHLALTLQINLYMPNVTYIWRTAPLTSKIAFYIFIQQIWVPNILNMVYTLRFFFLFKMQFVS